MVVETSEKIEKLVVKINELSHKSEVSIGGKKIGLIKKVVIECSADSVVAIAKLYVQLPQVDATIDMENVEVMRVAKINQIGSNVTDVVQVLDEIPIKTFEDVVKERDELRVRLAELEKEMKVGHGK